MNFKYIIIFFSFLLLALFIKAESTVNSNETAFLYLDGYNFGNIQWQQSDDETNWSDIAGATINNYPLIPDSTSYYRAKVNHGTCNPFYSETIKINVKCFECGNTLIDTRDGQEYPTVLIGEQCWFAKNLNIGVRIDHGTQTQSNNKIIEKYCYNNYESNCNDYGGLYTWTETMEYTAIESSQGICPSGWHVPSDKEWDKLEMALGMDESQVALTNTWRGTNEGTQLKQGGSSGYEALLSGHAIPGGYFNSLNQYEFMHSSNYFMDSAWRRCVRVGDDKVGKWNTFHQSYGLSVRCVRD